MALSSEIQWIRKTFVPQIDRSDCGVASLLSVLRYYGADGNLEELREISGTNTEGTTMLGLFQAARAKGFIAEGLEGNIEGLKELRSTCILHVLTEDQLLHYLVCYRFSGQHFIIGDPASNVQKARPEELKLIWKSGYLLSLKPGPEFQKSSDSHLKKSNWFIGILKPDISNLILISVLGLLISVLGIGLTVFTQQMIDEILPAEDRYRLFTTLIFISLLLIVKVVLTYIRGHFSNIQNHDFNNRLIRGFYSILLFLPKQFFNSRRTGELVARLEDTMRVQTVISYFCNEIFNDIIIILASLGLIFYYSVIIGSISLISIPLYFATATLLSKKIEKCQYAVMNANAGKTANYVNTIQGIDTIKLQNRERHFSTLNEVIYGVFQSKVLSLGRISINTQLLVDIISVTTMIGVLMICSLKVFTHSITLGEFAAIVSISGSLFSSIGNIAFANIRLQGAKVAFTRMFEFAGIHNELPESLNQKQTFIPNFDNLTLRNISFRFPGRKPILKCINLSVHKGQIVALTGECGCGKSTVINLIVRFFKPDNGSILVNDQIIEDIDVHSWRAVIGVVPQEVALFNGTLLYNICLDHSSEEFERVVSFCSSKGFEKLFNAFPQSYDTMLGESGIMISGGQRQLIGIARALYKRPQLLLLDEPTASMDAQTESFIKDILISIRNQCGILIVTHRDSLMKLADTLYVLQNGATTRIEFSTNAALT